MYMTSNEDNDISSTICQHLDVLNLNRDIQMRITKYCILLRFLYIFIFTNVMATQYCVSSQMSNRIPIREQIIIDYYMAFFISHVISTWDDHISPRAEGPRANMGRGLIWHVIWKMPYHILQCVFLHIHESWLFSETMLDLRYDAKMSYYIYVFIILET